MASGITFSSSVAAKAFTKQPTAWMTVVMPALLLFAGVAGALFSFITAYDLECDYTAIFLSIAIGSVGFTLLYRSKRVGAWTFPVSFGLLLGLLAVGKDTLVGMGATVWNEGLLVLKQDNIPNLPQTLRLVEYYPSLTFLWVVVVLFLCIALGYCIVRRPMFLPVVLVTVPFLEIGLYFTRAPALWAAALLFSCLLSQLAGVLAAGRLGKKGKKRAKRISAPYSRQLAAPVSLILCLVMTVCLVGGQAILAASNYQRPEAFETLRLNYKDFDWLGFLNLPKTKLGEGNLWAAGDLRYDYKTDLQIKMPYTESTLYFKGYTASVYTGTSWDQLPDSVYEEEPVFQEHGTSGVSQYRLLHAYHGQYGGEITPIQVTSVRAGTKYAFLPYFSLESRQTLLEYDRYSLYTGEGNTYQVFYGHNPDAASAELARASRPSIWDSHSYSLDYAEFVEEHYTQLPDGMGWLRELAGDICGGNTSIEEAAGNIREYLAQNTTYTTTPGSTPSGKDFTEYFLLENKRGYCTHYATAATLLLRAAGLPARYAEGYLVGPDEFDHAEVSETAISAQRFLDDGSWVTEESTESYYTLNIDDSKRHAWVEVYDWGAGWVPYEFTPGFGGAVSTSQPESSSSQTPSEPSMSSTAASAASSSRAPQQNGASGRGGPAAVMLTIFFGVLGLMAVLLAVIARQAIVGQRRRRSFHTTDENRNMRKLYGYLCKLLSFAGCPDAQRICYEPELLSSRFASLTLQESTRCMELVLKACFSGQQVKREEVQEVSHLVFTVRKQLYQEKNWLKRLWMQYGRCL